MSARRHVRVLDALAGQVALAVGALAALAAAALVLLVVVPREDALRAEANAFAGDLAGRLAGVVGRAVEAGIPLARINGAEAYIARIVHRNPEIASIVIRDTDGKSLFSYAVDVSPERRAGSTAAIVGQDGDVGSVEVVPSDATLGEVLRHSAEVAFGFALLAGLVAGLIVRLVLVEQVDIPRLRLLVASLEIAGDRLASSWRPHPDTAYAAIAARLDATLAPVRRKLHTALLIAEEIAAIDIKGEFRHRTLPALQRIVGYRIDGARTLVRGPGWTGWWSLAVLAVGRSLAALAPGVVAERFGSDPHANTAIGAVLALEAIGAAAALTLLRRLEPRHSMLWAVLGLVIAAAASAAIVWTHDLAPFLVARAAAGFGVALAVWALLSQPGALPRRPWRPLPLLLAAAALGPALGGILAEASDRRTAFAVAGVVLGLIALRLLFRVGGGRPAARLGLRPIGVRAGSTIASASAVAVAWLELHLGGHVLIADPGALGFHFAVFAALLALPWWRDLRLDPAGGLLIAAAALALPLLPLAVPPLLVTVLAGAGCGLALRAVARAVWTPAGFLYGLAGVGCVAAIAMVVGAIAGIVRPDFVVAAAVLLVAIAPWAIRRRAAGVSGFGRAVRTG